MSDWSEIVVDQAASAADAPTLARLVVEELVRLGYVQAEQSDCVLGKPGYPPAPNVLRQLRGKDDLLRLRTNGLEVDTGRALHISSDLERVRCPTCDEWFGDIDATGWQDAVGSWYDTGEGPLRCPACGSTNSVSSWSHDAACGFGYLSFTFWNWPQFTDAVWHVTPAKIIEAVLGRKCVLVYGKL